MITLAYDPQDAALANRLIKDLTAQGFAINETLASGKENLLLAFASPASNQNHSVQDLITQAFDNSQHVVVVNAQPVPTSKYTNHLKAFDFAAGYPLQALVEQIKLLTSPQAGLPLKVLTPKVRAQNRGSGLWLMIIVLVSFIIGLVLVGFFRIQAPVEEYNTIDTEVAATVANIVATNLPRSTEDAINFPATVQAVTTAQRPVLIASATALVAPRPTKSGFSYGNEEDSSGF
ncbi:MAG: hypothetical protein GC179_31325 [Anaerolineaceae bacterium]|nr:hypothetical protein [Anaerolineaceae bacterium]